MRPELSDPTAYDSPVGEYNTLILSFLRRISGALSVILPRRVRPKPDKPTHAIS
jgi:hypothetical protein